MKKLLIFIVILAVVGVAVFVAKPKAAEDPEILLTHFMTEVTEEVKDSVEDYEKEGLAGGVDGFNLRKAYPKLVPSDFIGVVAYQGEYSVKDGELVFTGNGASNSAVLERAGMKTLLDNISRRLDIPLKNKGDVDEILSELK